MKILIAGYPYIRENFLKTFDGMSDRCLFLLPRIWKAKGGTVVFKPPVRKNIVKTKAFFSHSNYPVIGGILKGWMPAFPVWLWRYRREVSLVYTSTEPTLLSTLYQGFWSAVMGKKHVLFTWENVPYSKFRGANALMKKAILKANFLFCDGIICGNRKAQEIVRAYTQKPTAVIPLSGVDTDFFSPDKRDEVLRNEYGLEGKFVFSFIGALGYRKGVHLILEAFQRICAENRNVHLVIAGSGEYEQELKNKIEELGLQNYVTMVPWADPPLVRKILSVTDAFLYPSIPYRGWEEQFGYSIAEAMAMAVPVISTYSGSISELLRDEETGLLVAPNDENSLWLAMRRFINDPLLRRRLGTEGRKSVVSHFSNEVVAEMLFDFFGKAVDF